ncbi:insulin gene enhancer protein ISL-1 [Xenopus tropicalis]|uniref:Insulin gene enhancer protein ISL-1 n=1 Tax=Xenopus tropicalis TaxID=8364 RepID=A0A8J0PIC3_XENTR|nr:insulin gene enhancer protein ISL-1 [Xenopus tropicalis]|eukprot:NP_001016720.1 insulin gene enhancer protein ISL-1 [Xenopus tropicalis]
MGDMGDPPKKKRLISLCVGCGNQIHDQYILRVSPDLEWHAACLKCAECSQYLDETCTCFVRDGKTYCKRDYIRYSNGHLRRSLCHGSAAAWRSLSTILCFYFSFFSFILSSFILFLLGARCALPTGSLFIFGKLL